MFASITSVDLIELKSLESIFSIWHLSLNIILILGKVQEMSSPMHFMVIIFGIVENQSVLHVLVKINTIKVIVPDSTFWNHKES